MDLTTTILPPVAEAQKLFSYLDYVIFAVMLGFSVLIGLYFGFCGSKQNTTDEYLLGGKTMKMFPVALSLVASQISGVSLMGVPADAYKYGSNYLWVCITILITCVINSYVYLPVFFKLQQTSVFEYLNLRFDKKIRTLASFIYSLNIIMFSSIVVYIPAVAFAQVSGITVHLIAPFVSIICIFYTAVGGLKAVVWTDAFQFVGMLASVLLVVFLGASSAGGFGAVWEKATQGHRLDFNFAFEPTMRDGFWQLMFGGIFHWTAVFALNPGCVQKSLAVPTIKQARKTQVVFVLGMAILLSLSIFTGNIMYANYSGCDPLLSKQVSRNDQILPHFVMKLAEGIPGLSGIFIAGIFSASLSTLSASLNTLSATVYEDFVSPFMPPDISQRKASNILKLIVVVAGAISTALVFVVERMSGIFGFTIAIQGITGGSMVGLFTLGVLFPSANSKGGMYGVISGLVFSSWIICGNQWYASQGLLKDFSKPVSVENCSYLNFTSIVNSSFSYKNQPFVLYRVSLWFDTLMGGVVVIIIGLIVSWFTRKDSPPVHPDLISPVVKFMSPRRSRPIDSPPAYLSVDNALHLVSLNSNTQF